MEVQNILFIQFDCLEKKEYFMETFSNSEKFFESFIPYFSTKLETYGTSSDVYTEFIEFEMINDTVKLEFYTYQNPCIEFCKRFSWVHGLNIQLIYYSYHQDYSGRFNMYRNQNVLNEIYSYYQGMYFFDQDRFWEEITNEFNKKYSFMEFIQKIKLHNFPDFKKLNQMYSEFLLIASFENNKI
jgi:hypothetical protein